VVSEHLAARLQLFFVHDRQDRDIVLRGVEGDNAVIVIDDLLKRGHIHRQTAHLSNLLEFLSLALVLGLEELLVLDELFLHKKIVLDPFLAEESQAALGVRGD
jgi:hypothetical protein